MADGGLDPAQRQVLGALRYVVNDEASSYLRIMRLFTTGMSGFLADQSAGEVAERLADDGFVIDRDTVDLRLSYLVEHGNLARSPRETEARSVREYLSNRARYQLTPRGELVHRQVEELLAQSESAREVSSEMLPGILAGITELGRLAAGTLDDAEPRDVSARITTLFAQFEVLVTSTRQFYSYLTQVLTRFDLGRDEFVIFKGALIDYLQRFVDEISRATWHRDRSACPLTGRWVCSSGDAGGRDRGRRGTTGHRLCAPGPGQELAGCCSFCGDSASCGARGSARSAADPGPCSTCPGPGGARGRSSRSPLGGRAQVADRVRGARDPGGVGVEECPRLVGGDPAGAARRPS